MTTANLIGQKVKTGRSSHKPTIGAVLWTGTAEIQCVDLARVPAALVATTRGTMAIVQLAGHDLERGAWWDARCLSSREWETDSGDLVGDVDLAIATQIDAFFATTTARHEQSRRDLHKRVELGTYAIA